MMKKVEQDARAYLRAIALRRGRNAEAAELAVTESRSYSDQEALERKLIDLVAGSERELLTRLDGREVRLLAGTVRKLATRDAPIVEVEKTFRERALQLLTDANVAFLMLLLGALLIYVEVTHAGMIVPGVLGAILLLLAVMGFSFLPINVTGVLLLLAGLGLLIAELFVQGFGFLGVGGVICLALGSVILVDVSDASLRVDPWLAVGAAVSAGAVVLFLGWLALRASRRPKATGAEALAGELGEVVVELAPKGKVLLHGEYWNAVAGEPLPRGTRVRCVKASGLLLEVEPVTGVPDAPVAREEGTDER
jgi:membrane-bound serine protease (ClpP class)